MIRPPRLIVFAPVTSGGLYSHLRNVMPRLLRLRPDWRIEVHAPTRVLRAVFGSIDAAWMRVLPGQGRVSRLAWEFAHLPRLLRADREALLWQPFGPLWNPSLAPRAVVRLENLLVLLKPAERVVNWRDEIRLRIMRHVYLGNARRALRPTCASLHSRARYVALTGLAPERFAVIPHGAEIPDADPVPVNSEVARICKQGPFVVTIGQAHQYRRTLELILAYRILAERCAATLPPLVWAGAARPEDRGYERECLAQLRPLEQQGKAIFLGQVAPQDVMALDRAATLFVHPSVQEDCPNTVLEALAAGAPTICAAIPANLEFAGDAVHLVSETTPSALAAAIEALLADPARRAALSRAARERARALSWDNTADSLVKTFDDAWALLETA